MSPHILVYSPSQATLSLLRTMFTGFHIVTVSSIEDARAYLESYTVSGPALDFVILDDQSQSRPDEFACFLTSFDLVPFHDTKVIHLYTPTTSRSGHAVFGNSTTSGVIKMTKPPRRARLLQTLAGLKNLPNTISLEGNSDVTKALDAMAAAQRILYGNVLIAEG